MLMTSTTIAKALRSMACIFVAGAALASTLPASATTPTGPAASARAAHQVTGFRSAYFGMTPEQVMASVKRDFPASADAAEQIKADTGALRAIAIRVAVMEPGPGPATVTYIFDDKLVLSHVNVVWMTGPAPTPSERAQIADGGVRLTAYFTKLSWPAGRTTSVAAPDASYAIMFAGVDANGASVEVKASGIKIERKDGVKTEGTGSAVLRVAYAKAAAAH
jgi:hypothetical protein